MGFLVVNILLALISTGAFWIATRPTGGSRAHATRVGSKHNPNQERDRFPGLRLRHPSRAWPQRHFRSRVGESENTRHAP